ncbi:hypothetical protein DPMN_102443 [Dreissena polymorpha]|uniref:Uncharacterized protein n=1 Tax=Dreissena polymorpha TaxID=45954 RepID=A0A9D4LJ25_DREPO|nr:hypothetical protein DPMN_102443 [Dreissena polymorpha]
MYARLRNERLYRFRGWAACAKVAFRLRETRGPSSPVVTPLRECTLAPRPPHAMVSRRTDRLRKPVRHVRPRLRGVRVPSCCGTASTRIAREYV